MSIKFTQFLMPNGREIQNSIDRPKEIEEKAQDLANDGLSFEIEMLRTGEISMAIENHTTEETVSMRVCSNGPDVPKNIDEMVNEAFDIQFIAKSRKGQSDED